MPIRKKIINDPVYGFINIPDGILFDLMEHPYFQRLRRIKQLGLTDYVYPGANHTRFFHAIGALHLMQKTIKVLRSKGVAISDEEATGVCIAILLHDIGHGPFSHTLEHTLLDFHHEDLSIKFMEELNHQFDGALSLAIQIFKNEYPKFFLHQLVSSQLDMDRMDYLNRDSFFTGVSEGVIGYDRIIEMLTVRDDRIVVEEKGIYSIEKFLIARRLMYWQVYLHKTVLAAEQMLIRIMKRAKKLAITGKVLDVPNSLHYFLYDRYKKATNSKEVIDKFAQLDDYDVFTAIKYFMKYDDKVLSFLSESLIQRKIFKIELSNKPFPSDYIKKIRHRVRTLFPNETINPKYLIIKGKEKNNTYSKRKDAINILFKSGEIKPISEISDLGIKSKIFTKHYLCYPKNIL